MTTAKCDHHVGRHSVELYLEELAEEETCPREAGTDSGVTGGNWLLRLQGVLKSVSSWSDELGSAGRMSPGRLLRTTDMSSSRLSAKGWGSASHGLGAFQIGRELGG